MKIPTLETLKLMTPERRLTLYQNAEKRRAAGGQAIIDLIDNSGLPLRSAGMSSTDPVYLMMEEIVWSKEGRFAATAAGEKGPPSLGGVDPLLKAALGDRYNAHDTGTLNAGYIVAALMRHLGYIESGTGKCPAGCVAKTGLIWRHRRQ